MDFDLPLSGISATAFPSPSSQSIFSVVVVVEKQGSQL
jgi:hypothetical protein